MGRNENVKCAFDSQIAINAQMTREITTCSTEQFGVLRLECDDSNKRIEVQTHKRYISSFHPKKTYVVHINRHEVEQM